MDNITGQPNEINDDNIIGAALSKIIWIISYTFIATLKAIS